MVLGATFLFHLPCLLLSVDFCLEILVYFANIIFNLNCRIAFRGQHLLSTAFIKIENLITLT